MQVDSVIFDLDGTLWDSGDVVAKAWNEVLREAGRHTTSDEIHGLMGLPLSELWKRLLPDMAEETRNTLMIKGCDHENKMIRLQGGRLFDATLRTLQALSAKYPLFIVSNCQDGYIQAFLAYHKLSGYFQDFECSGANGFTKGENIKLVMDRNQLKNSVYVGDAQVDCDGAAFAGIPLIYAKYGFGSVTHYDFCIESLDDLVRLL